MLIGPVGAGLPSMSVSRSMRRVTGPLPSSIVRFAFWLLVGQVPLTIVAHWIEMKQASYCSPLSPSSPVVTGVGPYTGWPPDRTVTSRSGLLISVRPL